MKSSDFINEGLRDPKDNPCWKGYKPVGTKKKDGKTVPNCVPKESVEEAKDDLDPEWDEKIARLKQMAKEGPRKTVYDPITRRYKTVPVNAPKEPVKESSILEGIASTEKKNLKLTESSILLEAELSGLQIEDLFNEIEQNNAEFEENKNNQQATEGILDGVRKLMGRKASNKFTVSKLASMWRRYGRPTDSLDMFNFLSTVGVPTEVIDKSYKELRLPYTTAGAPSAASTSSPTPAGSNTQSTQPAGKSAPAGVVQPAALSPYKQAIDLVSKLDKGAKRRLVNRLEKELGISAATPAQPTSTSSTGGTITQTPTGVVHRSAATVAAPKSKIKPAGGAGAMGQMASQLAQPKPAKKKGTPVKEFVQGYNMNQAGVRKHKPKHMPNQDEIQKMFGETTK